MRKKTYLSSKTGLYPAILACALSLVCCLTILADNHEITNYTDSFFGVYGKKASIMGKVDGSACEIWIYPYKVLHDYHFTVLVDGAEENPYERLSHFSYSPVSFKRDFSGEKWLISEEVFPAYNLPVVYTILHIHTLTAMTLEFSFAPDLSPMWPASLGGKYSYWDDKGFFVLAESSGKNRAFFGGFPGQQLGSLPAHNLPGGKMRCRINLPAGTHEIPLAAYAAKGKYEEIKNAFLDNKDKYSALKDERNRLIGAFMDNHLHIETPDKKINEALAWATWNLQAAFVDNPDLGEGLVAGYGLSGSSERPGFAWYFGGDGLINSFAVMDCGNFNGAKQELEFLLKYQRQDGKIMHELSQGAGFINWFGDYGFPFFHGDTTLYFISFLDFYVVRSGDIAFLQQHRREIDLLFSWITTVDADKDGIVETALAGTGASETGPLRQKMKTDIFLASLSVQSWQALVHIYSLLEDGERQAVAAERLPLARASLERMFWDKEESFYSYAVKDDGSKVKEVTIWPAIGMRFKVMEQERGRAAARKIASPALSTDWGSRFLSSQSRYYDPASYNNGAVWPFLTGFSALALYHYGNPYHAFALLEANLRLAADFDYGAYTELLSGELYRPLDQSVPNQIWSSGNTLAAFVEGLLGFHGDALKKEIRFTPAIPPTWDNLKVANLEVGTGSVDLFFERVGNPDEAGNNGNNGKNGMSFVYRLVCHGLDGYALRMEPHCPALAQTVTVQSSGRDDAASLERGGNDQENFALIISGDNREVTLRYDVSGYVYPYFEGHPRCGSVSTRPVIENFRLEKNGEFVLDIWGKGKSSVFFAADKEIIFSSPGVVVQPLPRASQLASQTSILQGGAASPGFEVSVEFAATWEKKSIKGKMKQ